MLQPIWSICTDRTVYIFLFSFCMSLVLYGIETYSNIVSILLWGTSTSCRFISILQLHYTTYTAIITFTFLSNHKPVSLLFAMPKKNLETLSAAVMAPDTGNITLKTEQWEHTKVRFGFRQCRLSKQNSELRIVPVFGTLRRVRYCASQRTYPFCPQKTKCIFFLTVLSTYWRLLSLFIIFMTFMEWRRHPRRSRL